MNDKTVYKTAPRKRLANLPVPEIDVTDNNNPNLPRLGQVPEMSWNNAVPTCATLKGQSFQDGRRLYDLIQHVGHAKRIVEEKVRQYVHGYLPTCLRKFLYAVDLVRMLIWFARAAADKRHKEAVIARDVARANHYIDKGLVTIAHGETTLSPPAQRPQWENDLAEVWEKAKPDMMRQKVENSRETAPVI